LIARYIGSTVGNSRHEKAVEFGTTFLRNISLHTNYISRIVAIPHGGLTDFINDLIDTISLESAFDLSVFFFQTANHLLPADSLLNPRFVLENINKMTQKDIFDKDSDIVNINKYTISMILNKYTFGHGVEPSFVQYMFTYMQSNSLSRAATEIMSEVKPKKLLEFKGILRHEYLIAKTSVKTDLLSFPAEGDQWSAIRHIDCKKNETVILKFTKALPINFEKLESVENNPITVFSKIIRVFDSVTETHGGENSAIVEEEGEMEEDDDDHDITAGDHDADTANKDDLDTTTDSNKNNLPSSMMMMSVSGNKAMSLRPMTGDRASLYSDTETEDDFLTEKSNNNSIIQSRPDTRGTKASIDENDREDDEDGDDQQQVQQSSRVSSPGSANMSSDKSAAAAGVLKVGSSDKLSEEMALHEEEAEDAAVEETEKADETNKLPPIASVTATPAEGGGGSVRSAATATAKNAADDDLYSMNSFEPL
jgi:hypothetical protein